MTKQGCGYVFVGGCPLTRLDFRRVPGPVSDPPPRGMSAGSFSRLTAGNRAYPLTN